MDSFELTKIAAGVLSALLLIFGTKTILDLQSADHGYGSEVVGYALPKPEAEDAGTETAAAGGEAAAAGSETAEAGGGFDPVKVASLVGAASAENGEKVYKKCAACHTKDQGGANRVGPNLWGIVGREKAAGEGFNYSSALKEKGGAWTPENIAAFIHAPKEYVPGTKMVFRGISDDGDLADLIAFLDTLK